MAKTKVVDAQDRITKSKKLKDPNAPKRPLTAYFLYLADRRPDLVKEGLKSTEIAKKAGKEWKEMVPDKKRPYEERAAELKSTYEKQMKEYNGNE